MILPALNTYGHENGWVPVFCDSIWTPQESDKMNQNGTIRPIIECFSRNWAPNLARYFSFPLFWNEMTKNANFYKSFNIFLL